MNRLIGILLFFSAIALLSGIASTPEIAFGDEPLKPGDRPPQAVDSGFNVGTWLVTFYRDTISPVDGDRCPSLPSCSSYSIEAFRKHGFSLGWMMTVDRLIHEGRDETAVSPPIRSDGKWKIYDPVANNDFWWYHPEQRGNEKK